MKKRKISKVDDSYKIYALVDPRDNAVRYVGISIDVDSRFVSHLHDSSDLPKATRIREVRTIGMSPTMNILETIVEVTELVEEEPD